MGTVVNEAPAARELYSGLRFLLEERGLTVADLARRIAALGGAVDMRSLQRLADPDRPLRHVDARVVERVCRALHIGLGDFLALVEPLAPQLAALSPAAQARLDDLLDRHGEGELSDRERVELQQLVKQVGESGISNAQRLIEHRERVRAALTAHQHSAAD